MAKQKVIIGNWKMYKTGSQATEFIRTLKSLVEGAKSKVGLAVPFTAILPAAKEAEGSNILIGAQNMNDATEGAFTGEIASSMLKDAGAKFVILGHSERRQIFQESNAFIRTKVDKALEEDIVPILCVGETLTEREEGHEEVLREQILQCLENVSKKDSDKIILAYEPVWAIGTGKTATPKIAQETHQFCRECLIELFGKMKAQKVPILYGGSVKPDNAANLMKQKDVNGALVGGASLNPKSFSEIVNYDQG